MDPSPFVGCPCDTLRKRLGESRVVMRRTDFRQADNSVRAIPGLGADTPGGDVRSVQTEEDGTSSRKMFSIISFSIAPAKTCPTSSAMLKSRNVAISASSPISRDVNGTSIETSLPRCRIIIAIFAEPAALTTF